MQFLQNLLYTKRPSLQRLLDIGVVLALVPHLFVMKFFMILYLGVALWFIYKQKGDKYNTLLLFMIGALCVALSFFSSYNFSEFSRMQFFVSLVSSLLIVALTLQRATQQINVYLRASPAMLMLLSFFFFDTVSMLFYSLFVFFAFVLLSIWMRMDTKLGDLIKFTSALFLLSLPAVVVLFIAFPRISFDKAEFGFRSDEYGYSGYDGAMHVSDAPFNSSSKVIMEVFFPENIPAANDLYFRGSTLYPDKEYEWKEFNNYTAKEKLVEAQRITSYNMILYPHGKKWIYPLALPLTSPKKTSLQKDYTILSDKEIYKQKRFSLQSALSYKLLSHYTDDALDYNKTLYPRTYKSLKELQNSDLSVEQKAQKLIQIFLEKELAYTTKPKDLDPQNIIDSFLFDSKKGYCTHFASAFAISARIVGIPSRVVSGYKADYTNRVENYLIVKQKDAHAWVELYLPSNGWTRFEPTATAYINLDLKEEKKGLQNNKVFQSINNQFMYIKYLISNWILGFDRLKQLAILDALLNDTVYLLKFIFSIFALIALSLLLFYLVRSSKPKSPLDKQTAFLLKILSKKELLKKENETMEQFLNRAQSKLNISLKEISKLYHESKYSKNKEVLIQFKKVLLELKKELH